MRVLILGGTSEASQLAAECARRRVQAVLSYAGRVERPRVQPVETRIGGFGGAEGLARHIAEDGITHVIDATHPFAAIMSRNAVEASRIAGCRLVALERPPWKPQAGDRWQAAASIQDAVNALAGPASRIFLAIGRLNLDAFAVHQQHHYLLRLVDPPLAPVPFRNVTTIIDRGPFRLQSDLALLQSHAIGRVVAKNAGGEGASSKILAARQLGLEIVMIERPVIPPRPVLASVPEVMRWLGHGADLGV